MASPEIVLTFFAIGLVLNSRRPFRSRSRHELIPSHSSASYHTARDEFAPPRALRRSGESADYRPVGTFTSHFYDIF